MCRRFFAILVFAVTFICYSFAQTAVSQSGIEPFVIVLDAGHGGHDPGNLGNGYFEKNIALNIVLNIGEILEKDPNFKVIYTRKDDTFIDLYVRGEIANKANADLFVSVHCDSHTSNAHGAGTFVLGLHANKQNFEIAKKENSVIYLEDNYQDRYAGYDINSPESVIGLTIMQEEFLDQSINLAKAIQDNFTQKLKRNDRKVKQAGFIVLHQTFMPSVLIETGFLTHDKEGAYLNSKKGQSEMGTAIANAIVTYRGKMLAGVAPSGNTSKSTPEPESIEPETAKEVEAAPVLTASETDKESADQAAVPKEQMPEEKTPEVVVSAQEILKTAENTSAMEKEVETEKIPSKPMEQTSVPTEMSGAGKAAISFKVQVLASSKNIPLKAANFKGLNTLSKEPYKTLYRYMYGNTNSLEEAELLKSNAALKGYTSAYVVAYKDGERITMKEALKYVSNQ
ncbi:N-acetylmuramoyl-L-alanine amidase [Aggregatimonas sangjinii]|uniref:N-acetylmuramoyl-L-alanine amidase n=2 Tax=Aggregatimonas sangjinii TaxID=2583587 RepID=A0A5B7SUP2_9FLAO|nr:N-acetylmuramoyl-L-alanine amidase [Aggregatimonas sangjinii]